MKQKILIVDDSNLMRKMIRSILLHSGYRNIFEAENGRIAVERYTQILPEVITMDINMPEMNGISAVREIVRINPMAHIIMVSSMGQQSMIIEAIECGAKDFIVKPFQPYQVKEAVTKALTKCFG